MQTALQQNVSWQCPHCGEVSRFSLNNAQVPQRKRISIPPICPTCVSCGAGLQLYRRPAPRPDTRVIVLTGTCASGKSTTAEALIARHGFAGIDGNNVMDVLAYRDGLTRCAFNGPEVLQEISREIDILLALHRDIVLSHVIIPDDLPAYRAVFRDRGLRYRIIVLLPDFAAAVARGRVRNVFSTQTAEEWIRHFHHAMCDFQPASDIMIFDNTALSVEESALRILNAYSGSNGIPPIKAADGPVAQ